MYVQSLLKKISDSGTISSKRKLRFTDPAAQPQNVGQTLQMSGLIVHLQERMEGVIPQNLHNRLKVSLDRDGKLVLLAGDSIALTQVKMLMPNLQRLFRDIKDQLRRNPRWHALANWQDEVIKVRVSPSSPIGKRKRKPTLPIPEETSEALLDMAETCGDDDLSLALRKLATHIR